MADEIWKIKLAAFLHDPPDKAISIANHEERRNRYLLSPLGLTSINEEVKMADHVSSAMQRIHVFPKNLIIDFTQTNKDNWPIFIHPLSAKRNDAIKKLIENMPISDKRPEQRFLLKEDISSNFSGIEDWKSKYLMIWRYLPDENPAYKILPADTRIPDHSIWDHMDVTSAIAPCKNGVAFINYKISPVQEFIEDASKITDLWAGSHLLSYISFTAMLPVIEEYGPDAIIFPYLRGQPFMDKWISNNYGAKAPDNDKLIASNIPNRFLAIVPRENAENLSKRIEESALKFWRDISQKALDELSKKVTIDDKLKNDWNRQILNAFHVTTQTLEWAYPMEDKKAVLKWIEMAEKDLEKIVKEYRDYVNESDGFKPNTGSLYGLYYNVISMMLNQKSRMFIQDEEPEEVGGEKGGRCTLCGIRNPLRREDTTQKQFWEEVRDKFKGLFKDNERLCAVCTVKRFYQNINEFNVKPRSKSVAWVATQEYCKQCQTNYREILENFVKIFNEKIIDQDIQMDLYEGLYLESYEKDYIISNFGEEAYEKVKGYLANLKDKLNILYENAGNPPRYYAILRMDGDNMGKKLTGTFTPTINDLIHPAVHIEGHDTLLKSKRLPNPNIHMAISRSLMEFSVNIVKGVIEENNGWLVYSGGDDVLALLPANRALEAACDINRIFGQDFYNNEMMMGSGSTMSAGIVFAHYRYPLYHALEMADKALKAAKHRYGRSAFVLCDIRRSGQISMAGGKWEIAGCITKVNEFIQSKDEEKSISSRFLYRLIEDSKVLNGLDNDDGKRAYIKYLLSRHSSTQTPVEELSNDLVKAIKENAVVEDSVGEVARCIKILYNGCRGDAE